MIFLPTFEPLLRKETKSADAMRNQLHVPSYIEGVLDFVANAETYTRRGIFISFDHGTDEIVIAATTTDVR